jgi:DNA-binding transcriptional LysR family regulator
MTFKSNGKSLEVSGRHIASFNDGNAYVAAGLAGLGVIQAPTFMVRQHLAGGGLRPILKRWTGEAMPLHVVYPPNRHLSAKLRILVDWLVEIFARSELMSPMASAD